MTGAPVAVIAGAGAAGAATALAMADHGYRVVVLDSRPEAAEAAIASIPGDAAEAHGIDLLDVAAVERLRDDIIGRHGRIDAAVHLVGGWRGSPTLDTSAVENWNALHPPVVGTLATLTAVLGETVRRSPSGRVFMVTSTAVRKPTAGNIAYVAAKAAAEGWMGGVAHYFRESEAAAVTVAVKALLTEQMVASDPAKAWPGYTHVRDLAAAIAQAAVTPTANGARLDLTAEGYSAP